MALAAAKVTPPMFEPFFCNSSTAVREENPQVAQFAEKLRLHTQTEDQVPYPAAIVLGNDLLKRNR